ncbi:MAG: GNAT family N-acetyltransferase [Geminicoccaceae bacterium]
MKLVPFSKLHFDDLSGWFPDEAAVVQWAGPTLSFPILAQELQSMIEEGKATKPSRLCWMTVSDATLVGHAQLGFDWRNGNATLSRIAIAPQSRGKGLAVPMLKLVLKEAFGISEIQRIDLNVYTFNTPAIRTYERLGFVREGVRRSSAKVGNQRWDTAIMGLLRDEWSREMHCCG